MKGRQLSDQERPTLKLWLFHCALLHEALGRWGLKSPCRGGTSTGLERRTGLAEIRSGGGHPRGLTQANRDTESRTRLAGEENCD